MSVGSATYAALSQCVAATPALLALARQCRVGQPIPNLLFAAVKRLLAEAPDEPLADHYTRVAAGKQPTPELADAFERFCIMRASAVTTLVRERIVQTNEVRRCSHLMPAFCTVAADTDGQSLALIDVGAAAGLNLLWDRYRYHYSDGQQCGPPRSPVVIECEVRGAPVPLPPTPPSVSQRVGIDLAPVNLADEEQYRWLQALIWPEHADRQALLAAARRVWLEEPPSVVTGDALELLPGLLDRISPRAAVCVYHCHALNQFSASARAKFETILRRAARRRTVYHVPSEGERIFVRRLRGDATHTLMAARRSAHGRWIDWQMG